MDVSEMWGGAEHDRDINRDIKAAVNILRVGAFALKGEDVS
jgi:hypothetical protein